MLFRDSLAGPLLVYARRLFLVVSKSVQQLVVSRFVLNGRIDPCPGQRFCVTALLKVLLQGFQGDVELPDQLE